MVNTKKAVDSMADDIPKWLNLSFLLHFFVGALFGVVLLVVPEVLLGVVVRPDIDLVIIRLLGGAMISIATSSLLAWREKELKIVKLVVEMEIVWLGIAVVVSLWGAIVTLDWAAWLAFGLFAAFLVDFGYFYFKNY
jgi:hypothetical protein